MNTLNQDVKTVMKSWLLLDSPGPWFWRMVVAAIDYKTSPMSFKAYTRITQNTPYKDSKTFEHITLQLNEVSNLNKLKEYALKQL